MISCVICNVKLGEASWFSCMWYSCLDSDIKHKDVAVCSLYCTSGGFLAFSCNPAALWHCLLNKTLGSYILTQWAIWI